MSNLKNVLKAGFLLSASLLVTACEPDNKEKAPSSGGAGGTGGSSGGSGSGSQPQVAAAETKTYSPNIGQWSVALTDGNTNYKSQTPTLADTADFDVFSASTVASSPASNLALSSSAANPKTTELKDMSRQVFELFNLERSQDKALLFDASKIKDSKVGAIFLDGKLTTDKRSTAYANVKGDLVVDVLAARNAVIYSNENASVKASCAFVAVDAAIGYPELRQDGTKKIEVPVTVHGVDGASSTKLALSAATTTKAAASVAAATPAPAAATSAELTLKIGKTLPDDSFKANLVDKHFLASVDRGELNIAGRVKNLETEDALVTSVSAEHVAYSGATKANLAAGGTAPKATAAATKTGTSAPASNSNPTLAKAAQSTATAAAKAVASLVPTQSTPAKPAAKPAAKSVGADIKVTKSDQPQAIKSTVEFGYAIDPNKFVASIGKWTVRKNSVLHVLGSHELVVGDLDLQENLGVRVFAEAHTFAKSGKATIADLKKADGAASDEQKIMTNLKTDATVNAQWPISTSKETKGSTQIDYFHYDSAVPFSLIITGETKINAGKGLSLEGIELADGFKFENGVYVLPLVKQFNSINKLASAKQGADAAIAIGTDKQINNWEIVSNGYFDYTLCIEIADKPKAPSLASGVLSAALMGSKAQGGRSALVSALDATVDRLNPANFIASSFATMSTARINQSAQAASLVRGVNASTSESFGDVSNYAVSFNHDGANVGFNYSVASNGTTAFGANIATKVLGLTAIVSADASVDTSKNELASASHNAFNAGVTLAKAYSLGGVSVVPMAGFGLSANTLKGYAASVDMAAGSLGLYLDDVAFNAATYNLGVNVALDESVAKTLGADASVTLGVAGYLAADADAKLSTREGNISNLQLGGSGVAPYAQFNLGLANGTTANAILSTGIVAVNFGLNR